MTTVAIIIGAVAGAVLVLMAVAVVAACYRPPWSPQLPPAAIDIHNPYMGIIRRKVRFPHREIFLGRWRVPSTGYSASPLRLHNYPQFYTSAVHRPVASAYNNSGFII